MDLTERLKTYATFLDDKIKEEEKIGEEESLIGSVASDNRKAIYVLAKHELFKLFPELTQTKSRYGEALKLIEPCYHDTFLELVNTGKTTDAFLDYIDNHAQAQKAVDMVFQIQANAFDELISNLKTSDKKV